MPEIKSRPAVLAVAVALALISGGCTIAPTAPPASSRAEPSESAQISPLGAMVAPVATAAPPVNYCAASGVTDDDLGEVLAGGQAQRDGAIAKYGMDEVYACRVRMAAAEPLLAAKAAGFEYSDEQLVAVGNQACALMRSGLRLQDAYNQIADNAYGELRGEGSDPALAHDMIEGTLKQLVAQAPMTLCPGASAEGYNQAVGAPAPTAPADETGDETVGPETPGESEPATD